MNYGIKTVVLGESTIGKTSLTTRLTRDVFTANTESTIGAAFAVGSGEKFGNHKFSFWDTAGQERYSAIIPMYYRDAKLVLLIFDMSNMATIDKLESYMKRLINDNNKNNNKFEVIVIGNKIDLVNVDSIMIIDSYVKDKLSSYNIKDFIYVSTKTGQNFDLLLKTIIDKGDQIENDSLEEKEKIQTNIINLNLEKDSSYDYYKCSYCV